LDLQPTGVFDVELGGVQMDDFDSIRVMMDAIVGGELNVSMIDSFQLAPQQEFLILETDGIMNGEFSDLREGSLVGTFNGIDLFITYIGGDGNDVALFTAVPELGSSMLIVLAAAATFAMRKHRRSRLNVKGM
jgi:hypothetical protein